jgi:hypothetical protein
MLIYIIKHNNFGLEKQPRFIKWRVWLSRLRFLRDGWLKFRHKQGIASIFLRVIELATISGSWESEGTINENWPLKFYLFLTYSKLDFFGNQALFGRRSMKRV